MIRKPTLPRPRRKLRPGLRLILLCLCLAFKAAPAWGQDAAPGPPLDILAQLPAELRDHAALKLDLTVMFASYGDYCQGVEAGEKGRLYLVMKDKTRIIYDDGKTKTFEEKLERPDLKDMLAQLYPAGKLADAFVPEYDPGRFRVAAFFNAVYGDSPARVKENLTGVPFAGQMVQFNRRNGAAAALAKVGEKLAELIRRRPEMRSYLFPLGGCFAWRSIAGTQRPSPHSWGAAIDLNPRHGAYWRWQKNQDGAAILRLRRSYPLEIVRIFEAEGFIWGGRWAHYDLMHFEYRPELLMKSRLAASRQ